MSSRNLVTVLVFALVILCFGCGGGGGGGESGGAGFFLLNVGGTVSGKVFDNNIVAGVKADIKAFAGMGRPLSGADVFIEEYPHLKVLSGLDGSFSIVGLPFNQPFHVIVKYLSQTQNIYRVRSEILALTQNSAIQNLTLGVAKADQTVGITLRDNSGKVLPNARVTVWGEVFQTDSNGWVAISMPNEKIDVKVDASGYTSLTSTIDFSPTAQSEMEISLPLAGSTNRPPLVSLLSNIKPNVALRGVLVFMAQGNDPDGDRVFFDWNCTSGSLASGSPDNSRVIWVAPDFDTVASVTVTGYDKESAWSAASIKIDVGGANKNNPPIVEIIATATQVNFKEVLTLVASGTDPEVDPISYHWESSVGMLSSDFGNEVYWEAPDFLSSATVWLIGHDGKGGVGRCSLNLLVGRRNAPPVLEILATGPVVIHNRTMRLIASATDPDNDPLSIFWSVDKGTLSTNTAPIVFWTAPSEPGIATLFCNVSDNLGGVASQTRVFSVINRHPFLVLIATSASVAPSESLGLTASATDFDDDPVKISWEASQGSLSSTTGTNVLWTAPAIVTVATVSCRAEDGLGGVSVASRSFKVGANVDPTARIEASATTGVLDLPIPVACIASDTNDDFLSYSWTATGGSFISPNQANTVWIVGTGPAAFELKCVVSDGRGGSCTQYLTVNSLTGKNLSIGEVAHFPVDGNLTLGLGTPLGNETFGMIFYPLNLVDGSYQFDFNGGGSPLPQIIPSPVQDARFFAIWEAQSKVDKIMRAKEKTLAASVRASIQLSQGISPAESTVGDRQDFRVANFATGEYATRTFELKVIGSKCKIFLDIASATDAEGRIFDPASTTTAMLQNMATSFDNQIFTFIEENYGRTWDKNGDGKVSIFYSAFLNASYWGLLGFFNPEDFTDSSNSNKRDAFYMCIWDPNFFPTSDLYMNQITSTLVHEFQHLVNYAEHTHFAGGFGEEAWLNEGLSMQAEIRFTGERPGHFDNYANAPETVSITNWSQSLGNYGGDGLYLLYLFEQVGSPTIKTLVQTNRHGTANIDTVFAGRGGFEGTFKDWSAALFRWGKHLPPNSLYDYRFNIGVNLNPKTFIKSFTDSFSGSMQSTALRFVILRPPGGYDKRMATFQIRDVSAGRMGVTVVRLAP